MAFPFELPFLTITADWLLRPVLVLSELNQNTTTAIRDRRYIEMEIIDLNGKYGQIVGAEPGRGLGRNLLFQKKYEFEFSFGATIRLLSIAEAKQKLKLVLEKDSTFWERQSLYKPFLNAIDSSNSVKDIILEIFRITRPQNFNLLVDKA